MASGTTFNVFDIEDEDGNPTNNAEELADVMGIVYRTHRPAILSETNPYKAGFPLYVIRKYCNKLLAVNYAIVICEEEESDTTPKQRVVTEIQTPGVSSIVSSYRPNNVVSLFIEHQNPRQKIGRLDKLELIFGISALDVSTNESCIFETALSNRLNNKSYKNPAEEIFRFLNSNRCRELVIHLVGFQLDSENNLERKIKKHFKDVLELHKYFVHSFTINSIPPKWTTPRYQNKVLETIFKEKVIGVGIKPLEFLNLEYMSTAATSYMILLEYVRVRNPTLIGNLSKPTNWTTGEHLILTHNALRQLDLIPTSKDKTSLYKIISNTSTAMGKRLLEKTLIKPFCNVELLEEKYEELQILVDVGFEGIDLLTRELRGMVDFQRYHRRMELGTLSPAGLARLMESNLLVINLLNTVEYINEELIKHEDSSVCVQSLDEKLINNFISYSNGLTNTFDSDKLSQVKSYKTITINVFKPGVDEELDELAELVGDIDEKMEEFASVIAKVLDPYIEEEKIAKFIKVITPKKGGRYLKGSPKVRGALVFYQSQILNAEDRTRIPKHYSIDDLCKIHSKDINNKELKEHCNKVLGKSKTAAHKSVGFLTENEVKIIESLSFGRVKGSIYSKYITRIETSGEKSVDKFEKLVTEYFDGVITGYYKQNMSLLEKVVDWIAKIDLLKSNALTAIKNRYKRPKAVKSDRSFIKAKKTRHPIVEQIQDDIVFIPNDLILGDDKPCGALIYGTNNGGKSIYLKSAGLNVVLAQCGMFVAAEEFVFSPFENIITRLSGTDNMERGQGSYAVEISELITIINQSTPKSLVLGDEICRGTTHKDAISVVCASLVRLCRKETNFLFSTHITMIPENPAVHKFTLGDKPKLHYCHFAVIPDNITDEVIYEYKLHEGIGETLYGIEIAEMMGLDQETCKLAYEFRNKLDNPDTHDISLGGNKKCRYNAKSLKGLCEIKDCGEPAIDTHHIREQKEADENGYIDHFHKNRLFNTIHLCKKHHLEQDDEDSENQIEKKVQTSNGVKLKFKQRKN